MPLFGSALSRVHSRPLTAVCKQVWRRGWCASLLALIALTPSLGAAQGQTGTVIGRVTDAATGQPVSAVNVTIVGTQLGALTGDDGRFTLRNIATGAIEVQAARIGYQPTKAAVTVVANQSTSANLIMTQSPFSLAAVVATATGLQRKVEMANSTSQIAVAEKIAELPVSSMGQVLSGRSAGVQVVSGGGTGQGSRIRIRGQGSLNLNNEPVVIIDGIRVSSAAGSSAIGVGGSGPSRLDDINPEEIESIEVIKGPSAATLYGTEAASGVVNITTKRGKSGKTRYSVYTETGYINDPRKGDYPNLYALWGKTGTSTTSAICNLAAVASGACVPDSLSKGNVLNIDSLTPISTGSRQQYGVQASGGNDRVQFFISGETETETGVYKMPALEQARLKAERAVSALPSTQVRPNALARNSLRANLSTQLASHLFVNVSSAYINSTARFPQNENNSTGLMVDALGGTWNQSLKDARGQALMGYRAPYFMGDIMSNTTTQGINRFINSGQATFDPFSWLTTRATVGVDFTSRVDNNLIKLNEGPYEAAPSLARAGLSEVDRTELTQQTVDLGATATYNPKSWLTTKSSAGMQYIRNYLALTGNRGQNLPPGATTVPSSSASRTPLANIDEKRTLGYYVEEVIGFNDRFFITGGLRRDAASAFGKDFRAVNYPKLGASWLLSEESFFPRMDWLNTFRVRGTYGASGQIPGPTDASRFYNPFSTTAVGGDVPGVSLGSLGNSKLKPEYSAETEAGFDLTVFNGRTNLDLTYYKKNTSDALIRRNIAGSISGVASRFENIGDIQNTGFEMTLNQRVLDRKQLGFDFTLTGSTNKNEMTRLPEGVAAIFTGDRNTQRNQVGYPLFGLWGRTISYADANGDGIIAPSEIKLSDSASFKGSTFPKFELAFNPTVELMNKKLRVSAQFDHKGNYKKLNNTLRHQCAAGSSCRGLYDKTAPFEEQAAAFADNISGVFTGMYVDATFTRFRELSFSYELPARLASSIQASRVNVVLTGRNLHVWTKYNGVDPEASASNSTDTAGSEEYFSTPPMRYLTLRLNITF